MKTITRFAILPALALSFATLAAAQTPATPPVSPSLPSTTPPPDVAMTVTVTGCLQRSDAPALAGTAGAVGTTGSTTASKYVLQNAHAAGPEHGETPDAKVLTASANSYSVFGNDAALEREVGHSVEISGTVDRRDRASIDVSGAQNSTQNAPKMTVIALKTLGVACDK